MKYLLYNLTICTGIFFGFPQYSLGSQIVTYNDDTSTQAGTVRSLSLGSSMSLSGLGKGDSFGNPASIYNTPQSIIFSFRNLPANLSQIHILSFSWENKKSSFSVLYHQQTIDEIPNTINAFSGYDSMGRPLLDYDNITEFTDIKIGALITIARQYNQSTNIGITLKPGFRKIGNESAIGIGLDFGIIKKYPDDLFIGLTARNIIPVITKWSTGTSEINLPEFIIGIEKTYGRVTILLDSYMQLTDTDFTDAISGYHLGVEYQLLDFIKIRGGRSDIHSLSAGFGIELHDYQIDYSYLETDDYYAIQSISVQTAVDNIFDSLKKISP